jgi:hypothetical protein
MGVALLFLAMVVPAAAGWEPAALDSQEVLEFHTVDAEGDGHWSKVWLVELDGDVYIRLGNRAADRIEGNSTKPVVKIRVGGEVFERVVAEPAPDMVEAVADAMAEKYWSDVFVRFVPHPLTLRLRPEPAP